MPSDFDKKLQDAIAARDQFNKEYEKTPYGAAGTAASKAIDEFTKANAAFKDGDTMGGSAAILRGLGALTATFALGGGPMGAAVGLLLGAIMGVIAAILESLRSSSDSLVIKIEKLIVEEALRTAYDSQVGVLNAWKLTELDIQDLVGKSKPGGYTWAELNKTFELENHFKTMTTALSTLSSHSGRGTNEWLHLFDITITYVARFWMHFEIIGATLISDSGTSNFHERRAIVAAGLRDGIRNVYFDSLNEVDFYSLWLSHSHWPYGTGAGSYGYNKNYLYHRVGVAKGPDMVDAGLGGNVAHFAAANSGTIFHVWGGSNVLAGRSGTEFQKSHTFDSDFRFVTQVTTVEIAPEALAVIVLYRESLDHCFGICLFDDRANTEHETDANFHWTPGDWRWGKWWTYKLSPGTTVLSLAVEFRPYEYFCYAFALNKTGGSGILYEFNLSNGHAESQSFPDTFYSQDALNKATYGVLPYPGREELSPVTVSCAGDALCLQVGNRVHIRKNGEWQKTMGMQEQLGDDIQVYQAHVYADDTMVFTTNKGLYLRYYDPDLGKIAYKNDKSIITICSSKGVSRQAGTVRELLALVTKAAPSK